MTRVLVLNFRNHMIIIHDVQSKLNQRNKYLQEDRSFRLSDILRIYFNSTREDYWTLLNSTNKTVVHEETDVPYVTKNFLDNYFKLCNQKNSILRDNEDLPPCPCIPDTVSMYTCLSTCLSISIMSFGDRVFHKNVENFSISNWKMFMLWKKLSILPDFSLLLPLAKFVKGSPTPA